MVQNDDLEFALREYQVTTAHLVSVLDGMDEVEVPQAVKGALILLARAINAAWPSAGDGRDKL